MSEFEHLEAYYILIEATQQATMNIVAAVFAYLVASHFAGKILTRFQALILSTIFTLFFLGPTVGIFSSIVRLAKTTASYRELYENGIYTFPEVNLFTALFITLSPILLSWIVSVYYLHFFVRKHERGI